MEVGGGDETFMFADGAGHDTIYDFVTGAWTAPIKWSTA